MIYTNEMINKINLKKSKRAKIISITFAPIVLIIIFFIVDVFLQKIILKKPNIEILGIQPFVIMTGSMEPELNIGDMIFSKKITSSNDIKLGDVITYRLDNGRDTVTHRVIDIVNQNGEIFYKTKGDNNNSPDSDLIKFDSIVGKETYKISKVGKILSVLFSEIGLIIIFIIFFIYYKISSDKSTRNIAREETRKLYNIPKYKEKEENV